jgi:hypothetical protein
MTVLGKDKHELSICDLSSIDLAKSTYKRLKVEAYSEYFGSSTDQKTDFFRIQTID